MKEWKAAFAMGNAASDGWSTRARHWVGLGRFVVSGSILGIFLLPSEFDVSQDLLDRFLFFIFYFFLSPSYVYEFQDVVNFRDCALFDFAKRGRSCLHGKEIIKEGWKWRIMIGTCLILIVNFCNLMLKFRNFKIIIVLHI